jgi:hypothetical protein
VPYVTVRLPAASAEQFSIGRPVVGDGREHDGEVLAPVREGDGREHGGEELAPTGEGDDGGL